MLWGKENKSPLAPRDKQGFYMFLPWLAKRSKDIVTIGWLKVNANDTLSPQQTHM